ncbi:ice-binding family protein [Pontibacter actiniarum]|nr:ice-binding family protein [Pontibacter actiniarum]
MMSVVASAQQAPALGAVYEFGAVASSKITNTGNTVVHASIGVANGAIQGFPPGEYRRGYYQGGQLAKQAIADARVAYDFMAGQANTGTIASNNLTGSTITPGVYTINGDASLNGKLTLNGLSQRNPVFIIKVTGNLTLTKGEYELLNNAAGINLFWVVEGNVQVAQGAAALGNVFARGNIVMQDGAQLQGRLIAREGEIQLSNNVLNHPADLEIILSKTPGSKGPDTYAFGETISYTIKVRNNGPTNEEGVVVTGIQFSGEMQSYTSSRPGTSFSGSAWAVGSLAYQEEVALTIVARVNQAGAGYLRGLVYGIGIDEVRQNNTGDLSFCVLLSETGVINGPAEVCLGDSFEYSIADVDGATRYTWSVPSGWSFVPLGPATRSTTIRVTVGGSNPNPERSGFIKVTASNTCGEGPARALGVTMQADVPPQPGPITGPDAICRGTASATYSIVPVANASSYSWAVPEGWAIETGQGTTEISVIPGATGGTVSVMAINACGSSVPQTLQVRVDDATPEMPTEIIGTPQGCVGTVMPFEVAEEPTAKTYNWEVTGDGWSIVSGNGTRKVMVRIGSAAGDITVRLENGCGVSEPVAKHVEPVSSPSPAPGQITGEAYTCSNQTGLEYFVEPVPTATYYYWTVPEGWDIVEGQGTVKIVVDASAEGGDITVVAINDCGTSDKSSLRIIAAEGVPVAPGPITGKMYGCANSNATYSIAEETDAASYVWSVPADWTIISGQGTTSIEVTTGAMSGKVTVAVVNGCGTGAVSALDVQPQITPPAPPTSIVGPSEVCQDGVNYEYRVNPVASESGYTWTVPADWVITSGQGTSRITVTAGAMEGAVTVAALNDCGEGGAASMPVTVVPSPPDQPGAITGPPSACVNQRNVTYSIEPVAGASSYLWSVGDKDWQIVSGQGSTSIVVNAGTEPTTISVRAVNACGVTSETQLATVVTDTVPATPDPITGNLYPCAGKVHTFSIDPVQHAFKYNWSVPEGWQVLEDNGTSITVETDGTAGTVSVTAENGCGPGFARTLQVTPVTAVAAAPEAILGNIDVCAGDEVTFSVKEVAGASGYNWVVPAGWQIISGQGTASILVKVNATAGDVTVTSLNDCGDGGTISRNIPVNTAAPTTPESIVGSPQVCSSTTVVYSIDPVSTASSYTWSVPGDWEILSGQGTTSIEAKIGKAVGNVTVVAVNSCGGSGDAELAVEVAQGAPLAPGAIKVPAGSFCQGTTGLEYSVDPIAGANGYSWTVPAGWVITDGQGTTRITVTAGAVGGEVTVTATNSCGDGGTAKAETRAQTFPLVPEITIGSFTPCQSENTTYSVTANTVGNVDTYLWEVPKGWTIVSGQNTNTLEVIADGTAGKIKVTAKNSCGDSGTAEMEVRPTPAAPVEPGAIVGEAGVCVGGTVTYTIENPTADATYNWNVPAGWSITTGQGTATITVVAGSEAGTITVTGQNGCGSTSPASLKVGVMPAEGATAIIDRSTPCVGLSYEVEPVPGATTYTWAVPAGWSITSGQGTPKITVEPGAGKGDISVVVGNGGCVDEPLYITPSAIMAKSDLNFPNVFSPNNDGTHDTWKIKNLENYPDNEVTIINRWGNQVYHGKSYQGNWTGDNLSEGTYFYVVRVKLCDGEDKMFKGYVMIVR